MALKLSGGPELEAALADLGAQAAGRLGINAVRAGARVIAALARQKAPRGETGQLKKSIRVFDDRELNLMKGRERTAYAGTRLWYAHFPEFGTRFASAKPYLRPAADMGAQAALDKLTENLAKGIERETEKYRGK